LKGSPSTKKLPPAAKESKKEGLNAAHSGEVELIAASASGISQAEPTHTEEEAAVPSTSEDGPVATSAHEDRHIEVPVGDSTTFAPGLATAIEDTSGANRPAEKSINCEDSKPDIETSQSAEEEPNAGKIIVPEEAENPASKFVEATVHFGQPPVADEPKVIEPNARSTEDDATMSNIAEQSKEESKAKDTGSAV
jgi:hypothetical protein